MPWLQLWQLACRGDDTVDCLTFPITSVLLFTSLGLDVEKILGEEKGLQGHSDFPQIKLRFFQQNGASFIVIDAWWIAH